MAIKYSGVFEITAGASITVTSPSSSTVLYVGDTHNITWSTTGTVGDLKIELYDGSNSKTATISSNTGNDENFSWTVKGSQLSVSDDEYQIKILELDGTPYDYSSNFRIWAYKWKQTSDGLSYSETITPSVEAFKTVKAAIDTLAVTESISPTDRTWRTNKTATDGVGFSEAITPGTETFKTVKTALDTLAVTEAISHADRTWRTDKTASDTTAITEAVQPWIVFQPKPTDSLTVSESVPTPTTRTWRPTYSLTEGLAVSESVPTPTTRTWRPTYTPGETLAISESTTPVVRTWRPTYTPGEALATTEAISPAVRAWKQMKTATETLAVSETIPTPTTRTWKNIQAVLESIDFTEDVKPWIVIQPTPADVLAVTETTTPLAFTFRTDKTPTEVFAVSEIITPLAEVWRIDKTGTDTLAVTETIPTPTVRTWHHRKTPTEGLAITEVTPTPSTRTWRKDYIPGEALAVTEAIPTPTTRTWRKLYTPPETLAVTEAIPTPVTRTWRKDYTPTEGVGFNESVLVATKKWHYKVSEVLSVVEDVSETIGVNPDDGIAFIESVIPAIFSSCGIRKFQNASTESYGTIHKTGWFTISDDETKTSILRRLNVEYNSADPLNIKIYVDGDDVNPAFTHTLAAATDEETTNRSVRISRRAKIFMLELGTDASTNTNVTVEDIEVEVDSA